MIRFTCLCQERLEVPQDLAGGTIQCPHCGRLNDVPTLSDLPHLADDGTYKVDVERPKDDPLRLAELSIIYSKGTTDADGDVIDLRISAAELAPEPDAATGDGADDDIIPLKDEAPSRGARPAPRYNPETGELITPMELAPDPDRPDNPAAIPMAKAAVNYASGEQLRRTTPFHAAVELLMPVNVAVMSFVFMAHVFLQFIGTVTVSGLWFIVAIPLALVCLIVSHYGNVVDEIGPQDKDELPRPLRSLSFGDDIWHPFVNVFFSIGLCFVPALIVLQRTRGVLPPQVTLALTALLLLLGVFFLPGVMLTANTSGTMANLRPDRFFGMIRVLGGQYGLAVLTGAVATGAYGFGIVAADLAFIRILTGGAPLGTWVHVAGYPMLALGIYCAHLFCWHLGLLYRGYHAQFPWAYQRHVRDPARDAAFAAAGARRGSVRDVAAGAGATGGTALPPRPRDTRDKLRELRELQRRRAQQQQQLQQGAVRHTNPLSADVGE
jgi:hypothetical protein